VNRAQIERAEKAAEHLANRKHLLDAMRPKADKLDLEMQEIEYARAQARRRTYVEQVDRFERYRVEAGEWLIAQGVVPADAGWLAYEAPVVRESIEEFTRQQTRLAQTLI
jgi:hypothetical protein